MESLPSRGRLWKVLPPDHRKQGIGGIALNQIAKDKFRVTEILHAVVSNRLVVFAFSKLESKATALLKASTARGNCLEVVANVHRNVGLVTTSLRRSQIPI